VRTDSWYFRVLVRRNSSKNSQSQAYPEYPQKIRKNRNGEETVSEDDDVKEGAAVTTRRNRSRKKLGLKTATGFENCRIADVIVLRRKMT